MQNLESVAQKMTEFRVLLYLCTFVIFLDYPYELPCEIWISKNGRVIELGTKEDTILLYSISSVNYTVQTFLFNVRKFGQLNKH